MLTNDRQRLCCVQLDMGAAALTAPPHRAAHYAEASDHHHP
jgi:hypothetical protein